METFNLSSKTRDMSAKLADLRTSGQIPAIVYGHHREPAPLLIAYSEFLRVFRRAGSSHLVKLNIGGKDENVLIYEIQRHPVSGDFLHVDFLAVSAKEKISVEIPVVLTGESVAVREGGVLFQTTHAISVRCLPSDLVDNFTIDIAHLATIGDVIHVGDIGIDTTKYDIETPLSEPVVSVNTPEDRVEEETIAPIEAITATSANEDTSK